MMTVKKYSNSDAERASLRDIFLGQKDERIHFFVQTGIDPDIVADFMLGYYFKFSKENFWVVSDGSRVMGYLCGCLSPIHHFILKHFFITPPLLFRMIQTGSLARIKFKRLLAAMPNTHPKSFWKTIDFHKNYPAHLHINLVQDATGKKIGSDLMKSFMAQLKEKKIKGVYASVQQNNLTAKHFFEKHGFTNMDEKLSPIPKRKIQRMFLNNIYAKKIE